MDITIMIPGRVVRSTREKTQGEPLPVLHYMYFYRCRLHTLTFSKLSHHVLCEACCEDPRNVRCALSMVRLCDPCVRVCACVSRVCPGSPRCLFTGLDLT